jgi:hypothetical protein
LVMEIRKSLGFDWLEGYGQGSKLFLFFFV